MQKQNLKERVTTAFRTFLVLLLAVGVAGSVSIAQADTYDQQIQSLQQSNNDSQNIVNDLSAQASSFQDAINKLQTQISAIQSALAANQAQQASLQQQITDNEAKITQEKQYLGDDIKQMYVDGSMSSIEQLATSKNLSDYVDKEEYSTSVQDKIDVMIKDIADLQAKLQQQKQQVDQLVASEKQQNDQLAAAQAQQQQMLAYNVSQQNAYNSQISANQSKIAQLRAAQAAANRKLDSSGSVVSVGSCGGGYPASASGRYGAFGCNYTHTSDFTPGCSYLDNWGMCNRECVSYTAWMVSETYGIDTVGFGNANQWPASARGAGIPTGSTPKVGSVAISMAGSFGHAMWVVGVSGGEVHVYSYNDGYDGNFYDHWVNASGLTYIYFGE